MALTRLVGLVSAWGRIPSALLTVQCPYTPAGSGSGGPCPACEVAPVPAEGQTALAARRPHRAGAFPERRAAGPAATGTGPERRVGRGDRTPPTGLRPGSALG